MRARAPIGFFVNLSHFKRDICKLQFDAYLVDGSLRVLVSLKTSWDSWQLFQFINTRLQLFNELCDLWVFAIQILISKWQWIRTTRQQKTDLSLKVGKVEVVQLGLHLESGGRKLSSKSKLSKLNFGSKSKLNFQVRLDFDLWIRDALSPSGRCLGDGDLPFAAVLKKNSTEILWSNLKEQSKSVWKLDLNWLVDEFILDSY